MSTGHPTSTGHSAPETAGESGASATGEHATADATLTVLVYSDDPKTRDQVRLAVGRRPASDLPRIDYVEYASADDVVSAVDEGDVDIAILDGEAAPTGGIGLCRQLKNEVRRCPPILLLTGRRDDRWLAVWSQADAAVPHPIDALVLVDAVVELARSLPRRATAIRTV